MTVIVTAVFHAALGHRDELVAALESTMPAVHDEQGCELYAIHDAEDGTLVMLEKWSTAAELDAHAAGPAVAALDAAIAPHLASPVVVTRMSAIPTGSTGRGLL